MIAKSIGAPGGGLDAFAPGLGPQGRTGTAVLRGASPPLAGREVAPGAAPANQFTVRVAMATFIALIRMPAASVESPPASAASARSRPVLV
jgi:hypothetical protein